MYGILSVQFVWAMALLLSVPAGSNKIQRSDEELAAFV
jgi:hypothetical protein